MKFYGYSGCSTCRKALQWLAARDLHAEMLDITQTPPSLSELELALAQLGRKRLFNTSGQSYRALGSATVQALDDRGRRALGRDDARPVQHLEAGHAGLFHGHELRHQ